MPVVRQVTNRLIPGQEMVDLEGTDVVRRGSALTDVIVACLGPVTGGESEPRIKRKP